MWLQVTFSCNVRNERNLSDLTKVFLTFYFQGASSDDVSVILECLDAMINRRHKQVSIQRVLAYLKRLCTLSLQSLPNASLSYLCSVRNVMKVSIDQRWASSNNPKTFILLQLVFAVLTMQQAFWMCLFLHLKCIASFFEFLSKKHVVQYSRLSSSPFHILVWEHEIWWIDNNNKSNWSLFYDILILLHQGYKQLNVYRKRKLQLIYPVWSWYQYFRSNCTVNFQIWNELLQS